MLKSALYCAKLQPKLGNTCRTKSTYVDLQSLFQLFVRNTYDGRIPTYAPIKNYFWKAPLC